VTPRRNLDLVAVQDHERVGAASLWIGRCGGCEQRRMVRSYRLVAEVRVGTVAVVGTGRWSQRVRVSAVADERGDVDVAEVRS
jgi:hypothetical protein